VYFAFSTKMFWVTAWFT